MSLTDTWRALESAARDYAATGDMTQAKALADAAEAYARARWTAKSGRGGTKDSTGTKRHSGVVVPFGREKGTPIEEMETRSLLRLAGYIEDNLDEPGRDHYRAENVALLEAIRAELSTR